MPRLRLPFFVMSVLPLVAAGTIRADAQESRAAIITAQQAEKAAKVTPYVPGAAERTVVKLQREFLQDPNGFYPLFASVYSGGGFTLGGGYRRFYGDRTHADLKGMYSIKNYKLFEVSTDSWGHADNRLDLHARVGWRDATEVAFHGVGMDTPVDSANYRMKQAYAGGDVSARPFRWVVADAGLSFEDFTLEQGTGPPPSIEAVNTP